MILVGIIIPLIGTMIGSAFVFFTKNGINIMFKQAMLGISSGVMFASSIWSLLIPSITISSGLGFLSLIPPISGLCAGLALLLIISKMFKKDSNNMKSISKKTSLLCLAVVIHNIPEGLAVGVMFGSSLTDASLVPLMTSFIFALGIGIQNIPEGAIISLPQNITLNNKGKSFLLGVLSGVVEPIFSILAILFTRISSYLLPYLLSFAAGAMIYVVVEELIKESHEISDSCVTIISFMIGFIIMMSLDVIFG